MTHKVISLALSIGVVILGIYLSLTTNRVFYGLVLAGVLYGIYDIYRIATHKKQAQKLEETQRKLAEQGTFDNAPDAEHIDETKPAAAADSGTGIATITVHWFKEKMGAGALPIVVNGVSAGVIKKDSLQVTYHTNVPFNVIHMGIYKAEVTLSPGDTAEYFVAGNGIRHDRTVITRAK